jgi:alkaline phosphatase
VRFAETHPGTLIVVTGDHATGGLAIENVAPPDESGARESSEDGPFTVAGSDTEFVVDWTSGGHTGESTPLTAEGPGAAVLARAQRNTDVHAAILRAMGG